MREKSVILDFVEQTKARVKELSTTVKEVTRDAELHTRAAQKVVKHATKEMARLEKLLPAKKTRKKRKAKVNAPVAGAVAEITEAEHDTIKRGGSLPTGRARTKVISGTYGTKPLPAKTRAPAEEEAAE